MEKISDMAGLDGGHEVRNEQANKQEETENVDEAIKKDARCKNYNGVSTN